VFSALSSLRIFDDSSLTFQIFKRSVAAQSYFHLLLCPSPLSWTLRVRPEISPEHFEEAQSFLFSFPSTQAALLFFI